MHIHQVCGTNRHGGESEQGIIRSGIDTLVRDRMCGSWYIRHWIEHISFDQKYISTAISQQMIQL